MEILNIGSVETYTQETSNMSQSKLSEHLNTKGAIELCPQCFKPLTQYWNIKRIEPTTGGLSLLTSQRGCTCGYKEEDKTKVKMFHDGGCYGCSSGCDGGCK